MRAACALLDQLRQKQLGHEILLRGHQGLNQIGARRPMVRAQRQRLQIERDGVVRISRPETYIAEVAPARRQMRRQPQRGLVASGGKFEIATTHAGIAEIRMQFRNRVGGNESGRSVFGDGEAASKRGDRFIDPAGGVMLAPDVQIARGVGAGDFGSPDTRC